MRVRICPLQHDRECKDTWETDNKYPSLSWTNTADHYCIHFPISHKLSILPTSVWMCAREHCTCTCWSWMIQEDLIWKMGKKVLMQCIRAFYLLFSADRPRNWDAVNKIKNWRSSLNRHADSLLLPLLCLLWLWFTCIGVQLVIPFPLAVFEQYVVSCVRQKPITINNKRNDFGSRVWVCNWMWPIAQFTFAAKRKTIIMIIIMIIYILLINKMEHGVARHDAEREK